MRWPVSMGSVCSSRCSRLVPAWSIRREALSMESVLALRPRSWALSGGVTTRCLPRRWCRFAGGLPRWRVPLPHPLPCFIRASPGVGALLSGLARRLPRNLEVLVSLSSCRRRGRLLLRTSTSGSSGWGWELVGDIGPRIASLVSSRSIHVAATVGIVLGALVGVGQHLMGRLDLLEPRRDFILAARVAVWVVEQSCKRRLAV
jgi:hypothetical protein